MSQQAGALASEKEARDVAEAARESEWSGPSFVRELFLGRFRLDLIHPYPAEDPNEAARAKPFVPAASNMEISSNTPAITSRKNTNVRLFRHFCGAWQLKKFSRFHRG